MREKKPKKKAEDFTIVTKEVYKNGNLYFELQGNKPFPDVKPGQFVQVQVKNNPAIFLRRPFSVHDWDETSGKLSLWIKIVGKGTFSLSEMETQQKLNIIYPLGNGFTLPEKGDVLLVGGGYGSAPLYFLAKKMLHLKIQPCILLGATSENEFLHLEKYRQIADVHAITEYGSTMAQGLVTQHSLLGRDIKKFKQIYACGPLAMLKAVGAIAHINNIPCQVSLENRMACGIGACLCCVVRTKSGNVCCCTEGPIFNTDDLAEWFYE